MKRWFQSPLVMFSLGCIAGARTTRWMAEGYLEPADPRILLWTIYIAAAAAPVWLVAWWVYMGRGD